jgi:hypothetical protein
VSCWGNLRRRRGSFDTKQTAVTQKCAAVFFRKLSRGSSCCHCFDLHRRMTGSCCVMLRSLDSCWNSKKVSCFSFADFRRSFMCYSNTYLLTNSMEQSPSWEASRFSGAQEIPRVLWNPAVHYRIRKYPPPVRILNQLDPVRTLTPHSLKIMCYNNNISFLTCNAECLSFKLLDDLNTLRTGDADLRF